MGKLFETIPIDANEIKELVLKHWGLELGDCVKASQNHTFLAKSAPPSTQSWIVRVTPDPENKRGANIDAEVALLQYLDANKLAVCTTVASQLTKSHVIHHNEKHICVFAYASGEPVNYLEWKWMTEKERVVGLGLWLSRLHVLTKKYVASNPTTLSGIRHWTKLHDGVLDGVAVDPKDSQVEGDSEHFGLIHGDVNSSNYFWNPATKLPCVFDWDQAQNSWFMYDVAQPIWGVVMLHGAGSPADFKPVPQANVEQYTNWIIEGYESSGELKIDRDRLQRMLLIRRELYRRFCSRALKELDLESFMGKFCKFIVDWLGTEENPK